MKKISIIVICLGLIFVLFTQTFAEELKAIQLPKPQVDGGRPLMQVLKDRKSSREFNPEKLPLQVLSNLLWAASGVNRPELPPLQQIGKRSISILPWQKGFTSMMRSLIY